MNGFDDKPGIQILENDSAKRLDDDEFELLAAAGHDLMGAIEVEPVPVSQGIPQAIEHWHQAMGIEGHEPELVAIPVEDAASLPGVVSKFSAVQDGRRYVVRRHGHAGNFILKLPSTRHPDLAEIEYTGFQLCERLGLDCAKATIISKQAGVAEVLKHSIKVDYWDVDALADAIYGLLAYPALGKMAGEEGLDEVNQLKWENAALKVEEVYKDVLGV